MASIRVESSSIPMNSSIWERPRVLEVTTGALTEMKKLSNLLKLDRHWMQGWFSYEEIIQDKENML